MKDPEQRDRRFIDVLCEYLIDNGYQVRDVRVAGLIEITRRGGGARAGVAKLDQLIGDDFLSPRHEQNTS